MPYNPPQMLYFYCTFLDWWKTNIGICKEEKKGKNEENNTVKEKKLIEEAVF